MDADKGVCKSISAYSIQIYNLVFVNSIMEAIRSYYVVGVVTRVTPSHTCLFRDSAWHILPNYVFELI